MYACKTILNIIFTSIFVLMYVLQTKKFAGVKVI